MRTLSRIAFGIACAMLVSRGLAADAPATEEDRLRAALRDTMIQLRSAQSDLASLQAAQASAAEEKRAALDKFEALRKQVTADRSANDKSLASLNSQVADQKATIARLNDALAKAKAEGEKSAQAAQQAEALNTKLKAEKITLERRVADLQSKNLALFMTGNQILSRYAEFGLGTAISAKEPFVSLTRTKLENLVQDYQDELLDQRAK